MTPKIRVNDEGRKNRRELSGRLKWREMVNGGREKEGNTENNKGNALKSKKKIKYNKNTSEITK